MDCTVSSMSCASPSTAQALSSASHRNAPSQPPSCNAHHSQPSSTAFSNPNASRELQACLQVLQWLQGLTSLISAMASLQRMKVKDCRYCWWQHVQHGLPRSALATHVLTACTKSARLLLQRPDRAMTTDRSYRARWVLRHALAGALESTIIRGVRPPVD